MASHPDGLTEVLGQTIVDVHGWQVAFLVVLWRPGLLPSPGGFSTFNGVGRNQC